MLTKNPISLCLILGGGRRKMSGKNKKAQAIPHRKSQQDLKLESGKLSRREIIENIEKLRQGESLGYRLPKAYDGQIAVVWSNTGYPWRGGKYMLSTLAPVEGKAYGEKTLVLESDEAKKIAAWLSRHRALYYPTGLVLLGEELSNSAEIDIK
jgi:hypothetical protein